MKMNIKTSILLLTFFGILYVESADGRVPQGLRYALVKFTDETRYYGFLRLVPPNQHLDDPHSLRPMWMSLDRVNLRFNAYYIYMEMSHQRRYISEALEHLFAYIAHQPGRELPESALVFFADHKYSAKNFIEYDPNFPHPYVADDDKGGRIYIKIKNTRCIYYAVLKYMGTSNDDLPYIPQPPPGYFH
ncbi:uncharacterized protein LOC117175965 [Belonocnema kinseyi]|uniref:uncharacterized protein LOC117175965 n=1 Tax=Belonocnema kinseyi TaxID=2817044 RepID=UPI00143D290E|nr:uncharacterized protein LOC117175965 [Belonocnema kinseyi]